MQTCVQHPKIEAVAHCRRCKLPVCFHCVDDDYCPECVKLKRYVALGHSGRKPQLVETPVVRSRTMELMIQRLQAQAFDPDAVSIAQAQEGKQRKSKSSGYRPKKSIKTRSHLGYGGLLLPGIAPLVRVTRSPLSRAALIAVACFGLGAFFAHPRTTLAEPAPHQAQAEAPVQVASQTAEHTQTHYRPVYIFLNSQPTPAPAFRLPAPTLVSRVAPVTQPAARPAAVRQSIAYAPAIALPAPQAPGAQAQAEDGPARLAIAYPVAGGILRSTSYVKVHIDNPERVKDVNIALDGQPISVAPKVSPSLEMPLDTTQLSNGDHTLQIMAMGDDGEVVKSEEIPVTVHN